MSLYSRDNDAPCLILQAQIIFHIRSGLRPLQPVARGTAVPIQDFPVSLPPEAAAASPGRLDSIVRANAAAAPVSIPPGMSDKSASINASY